MSKDVNDAVENRVEEGIARAFEVLAMFLERGLPLEQAITLVAQVFRSASATSMPAPPPPPE